MDRIWKLMQIFVPKVHNKMPLRLKSSELLKTKACLKIMLF